MSRTTTLASLPALLAIAGMPAGAQDPTPVAGLSDGEHVSVSGVVATSTRNAFVLDYGDNLITVEMDDFGPGDHAAFITEGDRVTVSGVIDDAFFEKRTIEAARVFSRDRSTYYFASARDEEGDLSLREAVSYPTSFPVTAVEGSWVSMSGTVDSVDGRTLILTQGDRKVRVDTARMAYNPLDDVGEQQVDTGDEILVVGKVDDDLFEKRHVTAEEIYSVHAIM